MASLLGIVKTDYHPHPEINVADISDETKAEWEGKLNEWSDGLRDAEIGGGEEGWTPRGRKDGIDISYKMFEDTSFLMVRGQTDIRVLSFILSFF